MQINNSEQIGIRKNKQQSTHDKSIAQLSVWTRLCTIACRLCKLPALPSFGMRLGDTNFT